MDEQFHAGIGLGADRLQQLLAQVGAVNVAADLRRGVGRGAAVGRLPAGADGAALHRLAQSRQRAIKLGLVIDDDRGDVAAVVPALEGVLQPAQRPAGAANIEGGGGRGRGVYADAQLGRREGPLLAAGRVNQGDDGRAGIGQRAGQGRLRFLDGHLAQVKPLHGDAGVDPAAVLGAIGAQPQPQSQDEQRQPDQRRDEEVTEVAAHGRALGTG